MVKKRQIKKRIKKRISKQIKNIHPKFKIRVTKLDNKGRKGFYIYIKDKKTKKTSVFKFDPDYNEKYYIEKFRDKRINEKLKISREAKKKQKIYRKDIKTKGRIEDWIKKGLTQTEITTKKLDRKEIKNVYKNLLKPLVSDNKLLDILTVKENIDKIKHRMEMSITIIGENEKMIKFSAIGKTIEENKDFLNKFINLTDFTKKDLDTLKEKGFSVIDNRNVNLGEYDKPIIKFKKSMKISLTFRKAK